MPDKLGQAVCGMCKTSTKRTSKPSPRPVLEQSQDTQTRTHAHTNFEPCRKEKDTYTQLGCQRRHCWSKDNSGRAARRQKNASCLQRQAAAWGFITAANPEAPDQTGSCAC